MLKCRPMSLLQFLNGATLLGSSAYLRVEHEALWIHYEFQRDRLTKVTLMAPWD